MLLKIAPVCLPFSFHYTVSGRRTCWSNQGTVNQTSFQNYKTMSSEAVVGSVGFTVSYTQFNFDFTVALPR